MPIPDSLVMITTVVVVVYTHDLAKGVFVGVILSAIIFGWKIARIKTVINVQSDGTKVYCCSWAIILWNDE